MDNQLFGLGSKVLHSAYGKGVVVDVGMNEYTIWVKRRGEVQVAHGDERLEATDSIPLDGERLTLDEVKSAINSIFHHWNLNAEPVSLGEKWEGGMMLLQPGSSDLKAKEIPIGTFFHKIVMLRDRVRVMEQKINSNKKMSDEDKVDLQQYITRIYGSLTTFNVLFKYKDDHFKGESSR